MFNISKKEYNIYKNLSNQVGKIAKHNRQGSYKTRERYQQSTERFCKFIAKEFRISKFANISDKHLEAYIKDMQSRDLSPSTIKTDLAGIRFFHDKCSNTRNFLSTNDNFNLERRTFGGVNRSWKEEEFKTFRELCTSRGMDKISNITLLARNEGLRIHETLKIDRNIAEKAISTGSLNVVGKGGKERSVPLSQESKEMLQKCIQDVERGKKLFVVEEEKTHLVIKQVQNFINRNREHFQGVDRKANLTFHGLRHTFAQEKYEDCLNKGLSAFKGRLEVSELLGHERDDVTRIYLAK